MSTMTACVTMDPFDGPNAEDHFAIYVPAMAHFMPEQALDMIQLPLGNLNRLTAERLSTIADTSSKTSYCGVFALDPFTNWDELLTLIRSAGFRGVCNFPPLSKVGSDDQEALVESGFSFRNELEALVRFADVGVRIAVVCPSIGDLEQAQSIFNGRQALFCLFKNVRTKT